MQLPGSKATIPKIPKQVWCLGIYAFKYYTDIYWATLLAHRLEPFRAQSPVHEAGPTPAFPMSLTDDSDSCDISWGTGHPGLYHSLNSIGFMGQDLPGMGPILKTRNSFPVWTSVLPFGSSQNRNSILQKHLFNLPDFEVLVLLRML